jgi:hypothetical protein
VSDFLDCFFWNLPLIDCVYSQTKHAQNSLAPFGGENTLADATNKQQAEQVISVAMLVQPLARFSMIPLLCLCAVLSHLYTLGNR